MSPDPDTPQATLTVTAGPGIAINLYNGQNELLVQGVDRVDYQGPEGLYLIEWISAGTVSQKFVRLTAEQSPLTVSHGVEPVERPGRAWLRPEAVTLAAPPVPPSERNLGSSIALIIAAGAADAVAPATKELRLVHRTRGLMRASRTIAPRLRVETGESCRTFRVRPGRYHVQFHAVTGDTLNVSVPALPGRQTLVFLKAGRADLLVPDGDGFKQVEGHGIEPQQTVIISVAGDEEERRVRERVRLATVLLHDLAVGSGSLSQEFIDILGDARTDPLLKLYAALVTLSCLERSVSPTLGEAWPGPEWRDGFTLRWADFAARWLAAADLPGMPPDIVAARWQLQKAGAEAVNLAGSDPAKRIAVPPMLECSWRWIITHSLDHPRSVPSNVNLLAASRSAGGTTPWLCWNAVAATAAPAKTRAGSPDIGGLAGEIARKTEYLLANRGKGAPSPIDLLGLDVGTTALRVVQATNSPGIAAEALPSELALALSLPSQSLKRRLVRTNDMLDQFLERGEGGETTIALAGLRPPAQPPALTRPVTDPDDPQKGRFGKRSKRGGFQLDAQFEQTSTTWTRIDLIVTGDAADGTSVQFYLHDSFHPAKQSAPFREGRASITVTAWGGFTVGAWIPDHRVELELDLSRARRAPPTLKSR